MLSKRLALTMILYKTLQILSIALFEKVRRLELLTAQDLQIDQEADQKQLKLL
jgi:hypothetical protein